MRALRVVVVEIARPPHDARTHYRLVGTLLQRGHDVTYLAPYSAFGLVPGGVVDPTFSDLTAVDVPLAWGARARARSVAATARVLARLAGGADVVLASDAGLVPALVLLARHHPRLAVVWDVRDDPAPQVPASDLPGVRTAERLLAGPTARLAERSLHVQLAEERLGAPFAREHPVVPDGVRVPPAPPDEPPQHRVVALGALTRPRGVEEVLAAAERLAGDEVVVELVGAAPPTLDRELRETTKGTNVHYAAYQPPRRALESLLRALAVLSLPRPGLDGGPSPATDVWTSLAYGVPVVTTPHPASVVAVEGAGAGVVVPHGGVEEVADAAAGAVRELLLERGERAAMSRRAWEAARRHRDWHVDGTRFAVRLERWAEEGRRRARTRAH